MPSHPLYPQFIHHLNTTALLPKDAGILVACSGGVDSTVLLHLLAALQARMGWRLYVGHINYQKRGEDSEADEQAVREMATSLGLPSLVDREFINLSKNKGNFQELAREYRYHRFREWMATHDLAYLCVAHQRDDQVETILHRLLRGAGVRGLSGMSRSPSPLRGEGWGEGESAASSWLVRPLLPFSRAEVLEYAKSEGLSWREDGSNEASAYLRNRIRRELVPLLRDLAPQIDARIEELGTLFFNLDERLEADTKCFIEGGEFKYNYTENNKKIIFSFPRKAFISLPSWSRNDVLYRLFDRYLPNYFFSHETIDKLSRLIIEDGSPAVYSLPSGIEFKKDRHRVDIYNGC